MAKQPTPPPLREWVAKDIDELRAVWADLRPESDDDETERRFFGRVLTPEEAGAVFERWLTEAFRLSGATGEHAFPVPTADSGNAREQLDGLVRDGQPVYLIESKFWPGKVDFAPIALLHTLIGMRTHETMGLFFSPFSYTRPAIESVRMLRPIQVLLFDADDIRWALPAPGLTKQKAMRHFDGRMLEMVRRKRFFAARNANPYAAVTAPITFFNEQER